MFQTALSVAGFVAAPVLLLVASWVWFLRGGRAVPRTRRAVFLAGVTASTAAYAASFLLDWYLRRAHLGFWAEGDAVIRVGMVMLVAALAGLVACCFGKGYGRVSGCVASVLVFVLWWFRGMAAF